MEQLTLNVVIWNRSASYWLWNTVISDCFLSCCFAGYQVNCIGNILCFIIEYTAVEILDKTLHLIYKLSSYITPELRCSKKYFLSGRHIHHISTGVEPLRRPGHCLVEVKNLTKRVEISFCYAPLLSQDYGCMSAWSSGWQKL